MFITLLVLLCFNLLGEGFEVAFSIRLLIAIALGGGGFIWPDWSSAICHGRWIRLSTPTAATSMPSSSNITRDAITAAYRVARRDAHSRDGELASVVSNLSTEPRANSAMRETAFRLLCLNHTFTSYISALGATGKNSRLRKFSPC